MKKTKKIFVIPWLAVVLLLLLVVSCKKDAPDDSQTGNSSLLENETILETTQAIIGTEGGQVNLSDGSAIVIDAGSLSDNATINFSKIGNEHMFESTDRSAYDISGLPRGTRATYTFNCPAGKDPGHVGVFNYDPNSLEGTTMDFNYDQTNGQIIVTDYPGTKGLKSDPDYRRWIVEWGDMQDYGDKIKLIPMPFYMQEGGSCWAAATLMLSNSYTTGYNHLSNTIPDYLQAMQIGKDDGIGMWSFMKVLYAKFHAFSSAGATTKSYWVTNNLLKDIINNLDNNRPVVLMVTPISHAVLVVGYRTYMNASGYDQHELIIHDSKAQNPINADEGTMYTYRKWEWFLRNRFPTQIYWVMYPDTPVHPDRSLQTLGFPEFPSVDQKIEFIYDDNNKRILLNWDIDKPDGYKWVHPNAMEIDSIPATVKKLNLKLQLYNADLDGPRECKLKISLHNEKMNVSTYYQTFPVTLGNDKVPVYKNFELETKEWLKTFGDTTLIDYSLLCELYDSYDSYLDGWLVDFRVKGAFNPLNGKWDVAVTCTIDSTSFTENYIWDILIIGDAGQKIVDNFPPAPITNFTLNGENFSYKYNGLVITGKMGENDDSFISHYEVEGCICNITGVRIE